MGIEFIPVANDTRLPESKCPECNKECNAAGSIDHVKLPEPGDSCLCMACGALLIFDAKMRLRLPSAEEIHDMKQDREFWEHITAMQRKFRAAHASFIMRGKRERPS